ncbi:MAG: J domain-containing protein [Ruminococcaceae bacterium]|nr:J domain-containing protein [Oscillospiraceae bacterium]
MDPYKVLGVSPNATDDEIRSAYRALAKKYHPDNYVNSPIADVAAEKMKEINAAYDRVQELRKAGKTGSAGAYSGGYSETNAGSDYAFIRTQISLGNIDRAEELLNAIPVSARGGEWYFCMGSVHYRRGWMDSAAEHFRTAAENDPHNREYAAAASRINNSRQVYRERRGDDSGALGSLCSICTCLVCTDSICDLLGGDLISCC